MKLELPGMSVLTKVLGFIGATAALFVTIIYVSNKYLGPQEARLVRSLLPYVGAIWVGAALIWLVIQVVKSIRERRKEVKVALPELEVSAQQKSVLDALQEQFRNALRVIRESKLAKESKGDEALYTLPWVMLLGAPESGKTAALRESGVDFPYSTIEARKSSRKEQDPGCDFWFSRGGIILDLAGRLGTDEDEVKLFQGFLELLKHARRARPLDGLVVTVSIDMFLSRQTDQTELLAHRLRQRLDEMVRRLGIRFPIYVLFTKCDSIDGFSEVFSNLRSRDRAQVWGATISRAQRKRLPSNQIFQEEFDRLIASLANLRLQLLPGEKDPSRLRKIYTFPWRFAALRERLSGFLGTLFEPTPYSERPMFRGFYFASALGASAAPQIEKPEEVRDRWDPGRRHAAAPEPPKEAKNYFLENLFNRVVFSDRTLAAASADTRLRRRLWLDIVLGTGSLLLITLLVGMVFSFFENRNLISTTRLSGLRLVDAGWDAKRTTDLMALEDLRQKVEELDRYSTEGPRWSLRWGMYSGDDINPAARRVYFRRLRDAFVTPTANAVRAQLNAFSSGADSAATYDQFYTLLKAYLMMTEPPRAEASFLNNALSDSWKTLVPRDAGVVALKQLRFYSQQLPRNDPELQLTRDNDLVARARRTLSQFPALARIYTRLKSEGNSKLQPYALAQATGGKSLEYLVSNHDVPGVFTEAGWSGYFKAQVGKISKEVSRDDWVLGPTYAAIVADQTSDVDYERKLLDLYFAEYADEWLRFLEGISVRPLRDLAEARAALDSFSQQDSALSRLLMNAAANTMLRREPEKGSSITERVANALVTLGLANRVNREELIPAVADQFIPLHDMVTSPDGKTPALSARYVDVLGKVHARMEALFGAGTQWDQVKAYVASVATNISANEFQEGSALLAAIDRECKSKKSTAPIGPLLQQPLRQAWAALLRDAGNNLDGLWRTRIAEVFRRDVESRFPFNTSGQDLPISMLSQFLKPREGALWVFFDAELKMFLVPEGNRWAPAKMFGAQVDFTPKFLDFLSRAQAIQQALYGSASPEPSVTFDLTPEATPGITESLLEIDGQRLLYRNERPVAQPFTWPGKQGSPQAKLSIAITGSGERPNIPTIDGEWAFIRLINHARTITQSPTTYTVVWSLPAADGRRLDVRYRLQARGMQNPFAPNFFAQFSCPDRVTQLPNAYAMTEIR